MAAVLLCVVFLVTAHTQTVPAKERDPLAEREETFRRMGHLSGIPWTYLAAIDQYERSTRNARGDLPDSDETETVAIRLPPRIWAGALNPLPTDTRPETILFFGGIGMDGDGDGKADRESGTDALVSVVRYLQTYGTDELSVRTGLWELYRHPVAVDVITHVAKIYERFDTMDLDERHFPVSLQHNYTYRSTWGARRGWGGRRIHEGTDIFAHYGTPVYSTSYGYVEMKGWNKYGGWRIGIRDLHNNYHYYAHLGRYADGIEKGTIVKPGDRLGVVGSSGYGPPGTSGKFAPHLHYGMYKFDGRTTWSFDPYPYLRRWERKTRAARR